MALWITPPMLWMKTLVFPLIVVLNGMGNVVLRVVGVNRQAQNAEQYYTSGGAAADRAGERGARRDPLGVRPDAPGAVRVRRSHGRRGDGAAGADHRRAGRHARPTGSARCWRQSPHTRYPIIEGDLDHIVGMIHIKDMLRLLLRQRDHRPERTRGRCRSCRRRRRSTPCWRRCGGSDRRWSVVIDEHGGTSGVVTLEDLFEEVSARSPRARRRPAALPRRRRAGSVVPGTMRVDELGQEFDLELEHEEVDSVSGLVLTLLGRPPRVGDVVRYDRLSIEVTRSRATASGSAR